MSDKTKACNLTKYEIKVLLKHHGLYIEKEDAVERIKYLNSRLKSFSEVKIKSENNAAGWSNPNG